MAILGIILLGIGGTVAALHLAAWTKWKLRQRQDRRHWTVPDNDGWIRPPRLDGKRNFRL